MQEMFDELYAHSFEIPIGLLAKCEELMEKEKEQIKEAYATGMLHPPKYCIDIDIVTNKQSEQYYNETYNPDKV